MEVSLEVGMRNVIQAPLFVLQCCYRLPLSSRRRWSTGLLCFLVLASAPAWADAIAGMGVDGTSPAQDTPGGPGSYTIFGTRSLTGCSASAADPIAANSNCSTAGPGIAMLFSPDGTGAAIWVAFSASAQASYGHLGFSSLMSTTYLGGAFYPTLPFAQNTQLNAGGTASYSFPISLGGLSPSFVELTFGAVDSFAFEGDHRQDYTVTLGNDAPWLFTQSFAGFGQFMQIFPVDPTADTALLTVQGRDGARLLSEDGGSLGEFASLDLASVKLLDANGNVIPEPSALWLCGAGLAVLAGFRRSRP
jgi:hypothetical protein